MIQLERITRVAPIGLRPWDLTTGTAAVAGLVVEVRRPTGPSVVAVPTSAGVYVLRGLPGLGASERGAGDPPFWAGPPVGRPYRVYVSDPSGRYLPLSVEVTAPTRGLVAPPCAVPGVAAPVLPLFSAPSRPVPAGMAVIRAQLQLVSGAPASWALLEVTRPDASTARGVADGAGRVAVLFGYPEPPFVSGTVGPGPLSAQTWTVGVRAFFGTAGHLTPVAPPDGVPDLCDVLAQSAATVLADDTDPLTEAQLTYGRELLIRTAAHSTLLLTSAP